MGDVTDDGLGDEPRPVFYLPFRQYPGTALRLVVRTEADATAMAPAVRRVIRELEPNAPLSNVGTMEASVEGATARERFLAVLLGVFAAIAVALAASLAPAWRVTKIDSIVALRDE